MVDYISFIGFFVSYLGGLRPPTSNYSSRGHDDHHHPTTLSASNALPSPSSPTSAPAPSPPPLPTPPPPQGITLILGGYSYGSLLTTYLPPAPTILHRFTHTTSSAETPESRIKSQALDLVARWNQSAASVDAPRDRGRSVGVPDPGRMSMGGEACGGSEQQQRISGESSAGGKRLDSVIRQSLERSRRRFRSWRSVGDGPGVYSRPSTAGAGEVEGEGAAASIAHDDDDHHDRHIPSLQQICYLLISPLLPPISLFATMFSKPHDDHHHHYHHHHHHHAHEEKHSSNHTTTPLTPNPPFPLSSPPSSPHQNTTSPSTLTANPTLAIYGTQDFFSSHRKLRAWAEDLAARPNSQFRFREVQGAGHFWQEQGQEGEGEGGVERELRRGVREWVLGLVGDSGLKE